MHGNAQKRKNNPKLKEAKLEVCMEFVGLNLELPPASHQQP
jgi:hypothetical protein